MVLTELRPRDPEVFWDPSWVYDRRHEQLTIRRRMGFWQAQSTWLGRLPQRPDHAGGNPKTCAGLGCSKVPGNGTEHEGWGRCGSHGGNRYRGRVEAGWLMGHAFAAQLNVSPWDALLLAVRIAAGKVAYTEKVLSEAADDRELDGRWARDENGILVDPTTGE